MNSPISPNESLPRRRWSLSVRVVLWGVAIGWATHLWIRNPQPHWTSEEIPGGTSPIGFTAEGHLVTADGDRPLSSPTRTGPSSPQSLFLTTWDLNTGQTITQVKRTIPLSSGLSIVTDPNCELILTRIRRKVPMQMALTSATWAALERETGQLRFPFLSGYTQRYPVVSPDGRFLVLNRISSVVGSGYHIIDARTGKFCAEGFSQPALHESNTDEFGVVDVDSRIFTPDSQVLLTFEFKDRSRWIVFRSVPDLAELGRCPAPTVPGHTGIAFRYWVGNRLYLAAYHKENQVTYDSLLCFEMNGHQLARVPQKDIRPQSSTTGPNIEFTNLVGDDDWKAIVTGSEQLQIPAVVQLWNSWAFRISPRLILKWQNRKRSIQYVDPSHYAGIGSSITLTGFDGTNFVWKHSPDGQWLVDGGDRLRVYRTPPPSRWWRLPGVLLLLGLGWLMDRRLVTRKPVPQY